MRTLGICCAYQICSIVNIDGYVNQTVCNAAVIVIGVRDTVCKDYRRNNGLIVRTPGCAGPTGGGGLRIGNGSCPRILNGILANGGRNGGKELGALPISGGGLLVPPAKAFLTAWR